MLKTLIVGSNPGKVEKSKSPTLKRLKKWMDELKIVDYDFVNVIPEHTPVEKMELVDEDRIEASCRGYDRVFTLGNFPDRVLTRYAIGHYPLPHPSPRNRLFNDKNFEIQMLTKLRRSGYLHKHLFRSI